MTSLIFLLMSPVSWSRIFIPSQSISWLPVDWCSQTADAVCFCGCSPSLFPRALDVSPMQCSPQPLQEMSYTTPVFFSGEVLSVGRTNWDLKVLQGLLQVLVPCDLKILLRCLESPDTKGRPPVIDLASQCRSKGRGRGGRAPPVFFLKSKNRLV